MTALPLTVIVPTLDEERALPDCLESVRGWAEQVIVFDSYSTDDTPAIAERAGVPVVRRVFDDFATHKNWALDNLPIRHRWVLFVDADERLTPELRAEIGRVLAADGRGYAGYYVGRRNHFMGRWIRHGGWYPNWNLRLFRRDRGRYERRVVHEHVLLDGPAGFLKADLLHEDVKGLERYVGRHNVYSSLEAIELDRLLRGDTDGRLAGRWLRRGPAQRRWLKEAAYRFLPARPLAKFLWMYVFRLGFLDGRVGFRYCVLQMFYEYQVSLKLLELRTATDGPLRRHLPEGARGSTARAGAARERPRTDDAAPDVWRTA